MTVEDDARRLRELVGTVPTNALSQLATEVERIGHACQQLIGQDDQIADAVGSALRLIQDATASLAQLQQAMQAAAARHMGQAEPSTHAPPARGPDPQPASRTTQVIAGPDGSRYPEQAAWCADVLPPRVKRGAQQRTVGYADGSYNRFTSGRDGTYSPQIRQGLIDAGFYPDSADFLSSHVEMKAATDMIMQGKSESELVINNRPCQAAGPMLPGCDEALERYLPEGYTLTVHGTTQEGEPFTRVYRGKA